MRTKLNLEHDLTSLNRRSENVVVEPIVVSELKFRNVERQIFAANFMETSDHTAFEDAPETFNRIGVDCADNILPLDDD